MRRLLFDDTSNRGSDAGLDSEIDPVAEADQDFFSDDSSNPSSFLDRSTLLNKAKQNSNFSKSKLGGAATKKTGKALGDEDMFGANSTKARDETKEKLKQKARDKAKEEISKRVTDEGVKKGLEKGLSKGASSLAKEGTKKVASEAVATGAKVGAKAGSQAAVGALEGAVDVAGAATGFETFGLGFIVAFLLNIAISLGVSDAVDAAFELKDGNFKQARFLAIRAAMKVGIFIYLLIIMVGILTIAGVFPAIIGLFFLNVYMILGLVFKNIAGFQGLVWWERTLIIIVDFFAFLIAAAFIGGMVYYLCSTSGLGTGGLTGAATGVITSAYDWWTGSTVGSFANDICKTVNAPSSL